MNSTSRTGWIQTTLGEILEPSRSRALPSESPDTPYVGLEHIESQTMRLLGHAFGRDVRSSSLRFSINDVLYGKMRPNLNKVWVAEFDGLCSSEFLVLPKRDGINSRFLAMRLNAGDFVTFASDRVSGERPRVDFQKLSDFPIALPPAAEQERIMDKLTQALEPLTRAETASRRAGPRLQKYRSAVIDAAAAGVLTQGWRKAEVGDKKAKIETGETLLRRLLTSQRVRWEEVELDRLRSEGKDLDGDSWKSRYPEPSLPTIVGLSTLPKTWTWASPAQLAAGDRHSLSIGPFGSNLKTSDYRDSGVPIVFVRNIRTQVFFDTNTRYVSHRKADELGAHHVLGGDILITKMGDPPGDACLYPESAPTAVITADCIRLHLSDLLSKPKSFFVHAINSQLVRDQIRKITKGVVQQKVSLSRFSGIALPLPPLIEQIRILREVERRLSAASRLEASLDQQFGRVKSMRRFLVTQAIGGSLVPQDPNDEPASDLLERLRAQRKTETSQLKAKHMPKPRSKTSVPRRPLIEVLRQHKKPMTPERLFMLSGYQQEFADSEFRQDVVDSFYQELRQLIGSKGPIFERRPTQNKILLETE